MVTKKPKPCRYCGRPFQPNQRGRARVYCSASHRERAYQKRRFDEFKDPSQRELRLLNERIATLGRQRRQYAFIDGISSLAAGRPQSIRCRPYERSVESVRAMLAKLAPEVIENQPTGSNQGRVDLTESQKVYHRLAGQHHPDHGGKVEVMKDLNQLWEAVNADLRRAL